MQFVLGIWRKIMTLKEIFEQYNNVLHQMWFMLEGKRMAAYFFTLNYYPSVVKDGLNNTKEKE